MGSNISKKRHKKIIEKLKTDGRVNVNDLSQDFDVSPITIRRDLDQLSESGLVERIHGGALIGSKMREEALFTEKGNRFTAEKASIGKLAASLINEGDTVYLNSGSTVLEVLKSLKGKHVRVITNNAATLSVARDPQVELFLSGGEYRVASCSLVGDIALNTLENIFSSCTVLGTNSISTEHGLTSSVQQETSVNRLMVEHCNGPVYVVADSSKLERVSNFFTIPLSKITALITDHNADPLVVSYFEKAGVSVHIAPSESDLA